MDRFAVLTVIGRDRPGIVARVTETLFHTGCNIEDSSMTRLRGEFTVMLILRLPAGLSVEDLNMKLAPNAGELDLSITLKELSADAAARNCGEEGECKVCLVNVLGTDQGGIVYNVAKTLAEYGANVTDLQTKVLGTEERPAFAMVIEVELAGEMEPLETGLKVLAEKLGVEITLRADDAFEL